MKRILLMGIMLSSFVLSNGQELQFCDFKKIETKDGLCSPNIRKIIQDKYGFMWFATQEGLSRFDGLTFVNFKPNMDIKTRNLLSSDVFDLAIERNGDYLWALTTYGGLNKIDLRSLQIVQRVPLNHDASDAHPLWGTKMVMVNDLLFIGTNEGFVIIVNIKTGTVEKTYKAIFSDNKAINIEAVFNYADQIWILGYEGKIIVQNLHLNGKPNFLSVQDNNPDFHFRTVLLLDDHHAALLTNYGLKILDLDKRKVVPAPDHLKKLPNACYKEDMYSIAVNKKHIYLSGLNGLFLINKNDNSCLKLLPSKEPGNQDWFTTSSAIFEIGNSLFLGSPLGIAYVKNILSPFTAFTASYPSGTTKIGHSIHLFPLNDSILYSGANESAYKINTSSGSIERIGKNELYFTLFKGPDNNLFASRMSGTDVIDDGLKSFAVSKYYPELSKLNTDALISYLNYKDSLFFFASQNQNGLYIWNPSTRQVELITTYSSPIGLKSNVINRVFLDKKNDVWILCDNAVSVYSIKNRSIKHLNTNQPNGGKPLSIIMDMCEIGDNKYLAVYGMGIVILNKDNIITKSFTLNSGLNNLGLYKIFSSGDTCLIASSNDGLAVVNLKTEKITMYYDMDGLQSNSFEETSGNAFGKFIYMGGINGITRIDPSKFIHNGTPPRCYFSEISILAKSTSSNSFDLFPEEKVIHSDATQTTINFSAINYSSPERIIYSYRINGINDEWTSISNQTFIHLIGISYGTYVLQVKAANEDGVWSEPIELTLTFLPKWYQTWWFKSVVALLLMGVLYGLFRYRLWQIRKEQQIRQRIANDLHDDIGSTLNSVKVFTNLALMKPENNMPYLEQLKEGVQGAIVGVRDMVWVLDDKQDTIDHLVNRIDLFINPLAAAQDIEFEKSIDPALADKMLRKEEKRNLYLIIKEALNNSIKYSGASTLQLRVYKTPNDKFSISIHDNGKGFDLASVQRGNGLNNLQYRAQQIKYRIEIDSAPGKGTLIVLTRS